MLNGIINFFYPDLKKDELTKFKLLAATFLFTIGTYWLLRLLKDVVVYKMAFPESLGWVVGKGQQMVPVLKSASPFVVAFAVAVYTKLVDMFEKHKLFYIIISTFTAIFGFMTAVLFITEKFGPEYVGKWPLAVAGTIGYLATECFGSLVVALFWSFTVSVTKTEEAKNGFPFIIAVGQMGAISGSALMLVGDVLPPFALYGLAMFFLLCAMYAMYTLVTIVPKHEMVSDKEEKKTKPDFFAGIRLLLTQPYLMGVFVVSTFYEVAKVIVDYQMKSQAVFIPGFDFKWFLGIFGVAVNTLSFAMALLGTKHLIKRFGIRFCLLLYPVVFASCLIGLYIYYQTGPEAVNLLWATFTAMMIITATSYAVNNPTKEMMYIPTSKDAKFKTKGVTDMIGGRAGKAGGATIGGALNVAGNPVLSIANLMTFGTVISLGIIGVWILAAFYVGRKNVELVRNNQTIE
jgi:AAA family ATP:ADP antiporter